jgi:hypothetical protein
MKNQNTEIIPLCRYLKGKNPFGTLEGGDQPWRVTDDPNTIYWCVKSLGAAGPDNGSIEPKLCRAGRSCYKAPNY